MLDRNITITLDNKYTRNAFQNINFDFLKVRKMMYIISGIVIGIGIISLFVRGLDPGVDFTGGRTYVVRFDRSVKTNEIRNALAKTFNAAPVVKTFGSDNQVKITTKYLINSTLPKTDSIVDAHLYQGLKTFFVKPLSYEQFSEHSDTKTIGQLSSQKVSPTISYELIQQSFMAVFFGLVIIFIYIAFRFKNWKFGLGGVTSLLHDTLIVITMFSLFYGILPFSLEVDQHLIAALLTIIGYSIMDSVIIFDRIREYRTLYPKRDIETNINLAINSTLGRTINTSGTTIFSLIVMFIFGGEVLRGFIFALLVGITIGTYSSVFNATPVAYDLIKMMDRRAERKRLKAEKK
jgi:SecD/SecF fusion protein